LRRSYDERFSWEGQCQALVDRMWKMVYGLGKTKDDDVSRNDCEKDTSTEPIAGVEKNQEDDVPQNDCEKDAATGPMAGEPFFIVLQQIIREA
ncbi:unnamed protein product, partial [Porites evermanni]